MYRHGPEAINPGGSVAVGTGSTPVATRSSRRQEIIVINDSDTVIYLRLSDTGATLGQGIRLNSAGGSWASQTYQGDVCAIHGGVGTKNLTIVEV